MGVMAAHEPSGNQSPKSLITHTPVFKPELPKPTELLIRNRSVKQQL